jgi:ABC-type Zn uptake system ZnuABC Zn-binding protein ZnuA
MKKILILFLSIAALLLACGESPRARDGKLNVVASTSILGDVVSQIGGEAINLTVLMPADADPHGYELTFADLEVLKDTDVVFLNGLHLEEGIEKNLRDNTSATIIEVSAGIDVLEGDHDHDHEANHEDEDHDHDHEGEHHDEDEDHDHDHEADHEDEDHDHDHEGEPHDEDKDHDHDHEADHEDEDHDQDHAQDPHTWTSVKNVMVWSEAIFAALAAADSENATAYSENLASYKSTLEALDAWIADETAKIPAENRIIVADHKVWGYFARDYGFEVGHVLIPSFSTTAEPTAKDLAELIEEMREENIPAVFLGNTASSGVQSLAEILATELGREIKILDYLSGSLTSEVNTFEAYMRYNVSQFVQGLQ